MRFRTIALIGIISLAAFLRFYLLDTIPPALYPDEAMNGVNALRALERSDFRVFYPSTRLGAGITALAHNTLRAAQLAKLAGRPSTSP